MKLVDRLIDESAPPDTPMWERLTKYGRGIVNAALEDAAKHYRCARKDLVWGIDKVGAIHVKKKPEVSRPKERETKIGKREREKPGMVEGFEVQGGKMRIIPGKTFKIKIPAETEQKAKPIQKKSNTRTQRKLYREADIAVILKKEPNIKIGALAKKLGVSNATISRSKVWKQQKEKPPRNQFPNSISPTRYE